MTYREMIDTPHLLICGTTGSGKSYLLHKIINQILIDGGSVFVVDPKKIDYFKQRYTFNGYADDVVTASKLIDFISKKLEKRLFLKRHFSNLEFHHVYLLIDEYADLKDFSGKELENKLIHIAQLARAVNIHLIVATQRATGCISPRLRFNLTDRVILRVNTADESKLLLGTKDAFNLPKYGYAILQNSNGIQKIKVT